MVDSEAGEAVGGEATGKACGVAVAMLSGKSWAPPRRSVSGERGNHLRGRPPAGHPARWWAGPSSAEGPGWGGGLVVVRAPREPGTWRRGPASRQKDWNARRSSVNTDDLEASHLCGERRVREIQTKLHHWARDDPHRRFDDLFNLVADPPSCWWPGIGCGAIRGRARPGWTARPPPVDGVGGVEEFLDELRDESRHDASPAARCGSG